MMAEKKKPAVKTAKKSRHWGRKIFWSIGWLASGLTLLGFFGALNWSVDLTAHFRLQYAAILAVWLALAIWYLRWFSATVFGVALIVNLALLAPYLNYSEAHPGKYKLLSANIKRVTGEKIYEQNLTLAEKTFLAAGADFLVLVEARADWKEKMPKLVKAYPFYYETQEQKLSRIVILSRYRAAATHPLRTWDYNPALFAEFHLDGRVFSLAAIHPTSTRWQRDHQDRKLQYLQLAYFFTQVPGGELIAIGDFNTTPWSYFYRRLTGREDFKNAMREYGLRTTWPVWCPALGVPIDQCLYTGAIELTGLQRGEKTGSDHYPIVVTFNLKPLPKPLPETGKK